MYLEIFFQECGIVAWENKRRLENKSIKIGLLCLNKIAGEKKINIIVHQLKKLIWVCVKFSVWYQFDGLGCLSFIYFNGHII